MTTSLITRQQLEIINRKTLRYPLQIAEKDYFLALVMQDIAASSLGKRLVFKGGTALNHCYLEQYRFSEDLDFSSNQISIALEEVREIFAKHAVLSIRKDYQSEATIKIERLQYIGPLQQPNSLKVEIDYHQNVLLPPKSMQYNNVWGLDFIVKVMDIREICAEKIRAMSDRARYRDFYDLYTLLKNQLVEINEVIPIIQRKEIRKPISKSSIIRNWQIVTSGKSKEISQIYCKWEIGDNEILKQVEELPFTEINAS